MSLSSPWLLVIGAVLLALLVTGVVVMSRRRSAALASAGIATPRRRFGQAGVWLTLAGVGVLAVAVAGPQATLPVGRQAGTVIVAMDVSNSMAAEDVAPSRLAAAQEAAVAFIAAQPDNVDVGVVGFDQGAITTSLPTADHEAAAASVGRLQTSGGTSLAAAILTSLSAITGTSVVIGEDGSMPDLGYWPSATIVLFSDGEDQAQEGAAELAATAAQTAGIHIDTVGVGTAAGTAVDIDGFQAHTALDAEQLAAIAQTTGGAYHQASDLAQLQSVAAGIDLRLTVSNEEVPLAGAFTGLALLLLGAGAVLTMMRTGRLV